MAVDLHEEVDAEFEALVPVGDPDGEGLGSLFGFGF